MSARFALAAAYTAVVWALAAFGRDMLFNHNVDADLADDSVGAALPYLRVAACAFAALVVAGVSGVNWALARVPLSLAPFCLWTLASVAWTDSPKDTLRGSLTLLAAWGAVPILLHRLGATTSVRWLLHVIAAVCVASCLVAVLWPGVGRHSAGDLTQGAHDGLWRGIFSHKNGLGPWAAYGAALLPFSGGWGVRGLVRLVGGACALACLTFCGSATSVALAGSVVGLRLLLALRRRWPAGMALAAATAALGAGALAAGGGERLLAALGRSSSFSGRADVWALAWGYVAERPWLGYGYATLGGADFRARETSLFAQAIPGPESGFLALLLETGLVGCGLLAAAYVLAIVKGGVWLARAAPEDGRAVEFYLILLVSTLAEAVSESPAFVVTGYDGVIFFTALFALSTAPWPSVRRRALGHARPAHNRLSASLANPPPFAVAGENLARAAKAASGAALTRGEARSRRPARRAAPGSSPARQA